MSACRRETPDSPPTASETLPLSPSTKPFEDFLTSTPPGIRIDVTIELFEPPDESEEWLSIPSISLFCGDESCNRKTFFDSQRKESITAPIPGFARDLFLYFQCRHCRTTRKAYAVRLTRLDKNKNIFTARKFGELPNFGPPLPSRLINLFQPDAELLKRGFSAEILGFGVAAIIYYRRVVENQRDRLIDALIEVVSDRAAAAGFVMSSKRQPFGVDEIVSVTKESQISIWKVSLTKGVAIGDTVEVVSYYGAALDVFKNSWTIIGFGPLVIILQKTSPLANQTLVINAHAGTFVYSTTGQLTASLPSSSIFWGTCENE